MRSLSSMLSGSRILAMISPKWTLLFTPIAKRWDWFTFVSLEYFELMMVELNDFVEFDFITSVGVPYPKRIRFFLRISIKIHFIRWGITGCIWIRGISFRNCTSVRFILYFKASSILITAEVFNLNPTSFFFVFLFCVKWICETSSLLQIGMIFYPWKSVNILFMNKLYYVICSFNWVLMRATT